MHQVGFSQKLKYWFDNMMSKGPVAMISLLAILSLLVVVLAGAVIWLFQIAPEGGEPMGFVEAMWQSLMRSLDSGTISGDVGWTFRTVAFIVTIGGIFILSTLIGVLGSGIEGKLEALKKGRSFVIEQNHTLILGWSSKIFTVISELVEANENNKNSRIVVLADKDKVEMEDEIRSKVEAFKNTKVICRSGIPNDLADLNIANPHAAKSIIILAPDSENPDPLTIKTILALTNSPDRRKALCHIVAEIKEEKNMDAAKMIGKDEVELVLTDYFIGRIMVQTARQSGLSIVYTELMDFKGSEIYFTEENALHGKTYGEAIAAYEDSSVIGLQFADGRVKVNPPMDYVIQSGDKIIAITEDDDTLVLGKGGPKPVKEAVIVNQNSEKMASERILMLGWNKRALIIIREMDKYVGAGSYMKIVSSFDKDRESILEIAQTLEHIKLEFQHADTTARSVIDGLEVSSYNSVQLLCYKGEMDVQEADAQTLITLLHIRRVMDETGSDMKIVSEMLDLRNRDLAEVTRADDFIVSDKLISLLVSQVSENKYLMRVFEDIFNAEGSEIYLKPMGEYIRTGEAVDFYTLLESAKRKGQTAIGYKIASQAQDSNKSHGVVIRPAKSKALVFSEQDMLIVLSEN